MSESIRRQKVIESTPITEVIGECLPLHRDGAMLRSLCPFHDDRSPSLRLYPAAKSFRCYVCGASGDVVDFVRMFNRVTISKALDLLEARPKS
jgi:DNA primase